MNLELDLIEWQPVDDLADPPPAPTPASYADHAEEEAQ